MLVFIDESGDLGYKFDRGSTRFFTIVLVVFEGAESAQACQRAIEQLKVGLDLPPRYEFHFHDDSHERRLALLSTVSRQDFSCYSFTLDKSSPRLYGKGFQYRSPGYKWVCKTVLDNAGSELRDVTVVIDGSGERPPAAACGLRGRRHQSAIRGQSWGRGLRGISAQEK